MQGALAGAMTLISSTLFICLVYIINWRHLCQAVDFDNDNDDVIILAQM